MSQRSREIVLASPEELQAYYQLQAEIKKLIDNAHKPFFDIAKYFVLPYVINFFGVFLPAYGLRSVDLLADLVYLLLEQHLTVIVLQNAKHAIEGLLFLKYPLEEWHKHISNREIINIFQNLTSVRQTCSKLATTYPTTHKNDIICKYVRSLESACRTAINDYKNSRFDSYELTNKIFPSYKNLYEFVNESQPHLAERAVSFSLVQVFLSFFVTDLSASLFLKRLPFGFYTQFRHENHLAQNTPCLITRHKLKQKQEQLLSIRKHLENTSFVWFQWLIRIVFGYMLTNIFLNLHADISDFNDGAFSEGGLIALLYISLFALQKGINSLSLIWSSKHEASIHAQNHKSLTAINMTLNIQPWLEKITGKTKFYTLKLPDTYQFEDIKVSGKIIISAFIRAFEQCGIIDFINTDHEILLQPGAIVSKQEINNIITLTKQYIKSSFHQEKLEKQLKSISMIIYGKDTNYYYPVSDLSNNTDYVIVIRDALLLDALNPILIKLYGEQNITQTTLENNLLIKILAGANCSESLFKKGLLSVNQIVSNHQQSTLWYQENPTSILKKQPREKTETTSNLDTNPPHIKAEIKKSPPKIQTLNFGSFGTFRSNQKNFPEVIEAPFLSYGTHFGLFRAPSEAFATDEQEEKFKNIRMHVVANKGMKGLKAVSNYLFNTKSGLKKSSFKLKDPSEDLRVYDHTIKGTNEDGREVTLHIFDHVVAKAHK